MTKISLTVDGEKVSDEVEPRMLLVQYLREKLGKTGTVIGCDTSNCGACTVHLNGRSVKSCNVLAVQADGAEVTTIEGLAQDGKLHQVQESFRECHGLQCGFCTPGMIMQSVDLLNENPDPTEQEVRLGLEGNLCRCTGYHNIVKSVLHAAGQTKEGAVHVTTLEDAPAGRQGDRQGPPPQGGPAARSPAAPGGPTTCRCRACCTWRWCAARTRTRRSSASTSRPPTTAINVYRRLHRRRPRRHPGRDDQRLADHRRPEGATAPADGGGPGHASPARSSPSWSRVPPPRRATRPSSSTSSTRCCPPSSTSRKPRQGRGARAPRPRHQQERLLAVRQRRGRHRRQRRGGDREGPRRRHRDRARVPPAAADPGVHGAALVLVDPTGEQITDVDVDPDPAHRPVRARRPRTGVPESKIRVIAPDVGGGFGGKLQTDPGGVDRLRDRPPAREAGQVHRDPQREPPERPPRPRAVAEASRWPPRRTAPSPASRSSSLADLGSYVAAARRWHPGARRLHVQRDLQVPGLPVQLPDRASPTAPGPTPTAAPAGQRRRSRSSG